MLIANTYEVSIVLVELQDVYKFFKLFFQVRSFQLFLTMLIIFIFTDRLASIRL